MAPIHLPQGATMTKVTFYFYDNDTSLFPIGIHFLLFRQNQTGYDLLAIAASPGLTRPGYDHVSISSISYDIPITTIDNNKYYYYMGIQIQAAASSESYGFQYALVEYEFPT